MSRTAKAGGAVEVYTYDSQNRLTGYTSLSTTASYAYDALDRRIAKRVDGVAEVYVHDQPTAEALAENNIVLTFGAGGLTDRILHGPGVDQPLAFERYAGTTAPGTGAFYDLYADRMGSITHVMDTTTGAIVAEYDYDAYGQRIPHTASLFQFYGYTGREEDPESGLIHLRWRAYDPATGTFLQMDPIGFMSGDANGYRYVENDPSNLVDPSGLSGTEKAVTTGITAVGTAEASGTVLGGAQVAGVRVAATIESLWDATVVRTATGVGEVAREI